MGPVFASGTPNYPTPWFKASEMSAKYVTVALEDEFKFNTEGGDVKFSLGISYDAQKLSRNFGGRMMLFGASWTEDITGILRPRMKPHSTATIWGTGDGFNPVLLAGVRTGQGHAQNYGERFRKRRNSRHLHQYADTADRLEYYATTAGYEVYLPLIYKLNQIKPETSYNANCGFELNLFENKLYVRGDYFYAFYRNKIESVRDPNANTTRQSVIPISRAVRSMEQRAL